MILYFHYPYVRLEQCYYHIHTYIHTYLDELIQVGGFVSERIPGQTVRERDETMRKVVLRQPGNYRLLLHIWSRGDVDNQVTQFLPVPARSQLGVNTLQ